MKVQVSGTENLVVRLSGKLNETADLNRISFPPVKSVEFDLAEVAHINSIGIRNFREWLTTIPVPEMTFSFCPRVFIDQVNMVTNFLPARAKILSFYVPYYIEETGEEKLVLFSRGKEIEGTGGVVQINFPKVLDGNGNEMTVDVITERYFSFLNRF